MTQPIRVNMVSETEFTVKGHGVHTAYVEITNALRKQLDVEVSVNKYGHYDIVHIQTVGFFALRKLLFSPGKKVVSAHIVPDSFIGSIRGAKYWAPFSKYWLKLFYKKADLVLSCSGMVDQELRDTMNVENSLVFYNSVDMSRYHTTPEHKKYARQVLGIDDERFVVVGNGQVQPRKRLDTFIEMAKSMPDALFYWVGGTPFKQLGADYDRMQQLQDNLPDNMVITGVIELDEVLNYYQVADVFCLPAEQENHPMCVLEASGANLPIILRNIPQYEDTFKIGAILCDTDADFIQALQRLREDAAYYQQAKEGSMRIAERFDSHRAAQKLAKLYAELLIEK